MASKRLDFICQESDCLIGLHGPIRQGDSLSFFRFKMGKLSQKSSAPSPKRLSANYLINVEQDSSSRFFGRSVSRISRSLKSKQKELNTFSFRTFSKGIWSGSRSWNQMPASQKKEIVLFRNFGWSDDILIRKEFQIWRFRGQFEVMIWWGNSSKKLNEASGLFD